MFLQKATTHRGLVPLESLRRGRPGDGVVGSAGDVRRGGAVEPRSQGGRAAGPPAMRTAVDLVSGVLDDVLDEVIPQAAAHGSLYIRLWEELRRAVRGGKRFRGRLVVELHDALGGRQRVAAAEVGAAFELLHAGFLVHDDLIDRDTMRRGEPNLAARMAGGAREAGASEPEEIGRASCRGRVENEDGAG